MYCIVKSISSSIYYTYSPNVGVTYDGRVLKVAGTIVPPKCNRCKSKVMARRIRPGWRRWNNRRLFLAREGEKMKRAKKIKEAAFIRWSRLLE